MLPYICLWSYCLVFLDAFSSVIIFIYTWLCVKVSLKNTSHYFKQQTIKLKQEKANKAIQDENTDILVCKRLPKHEANLECCPTCQKEFANLSVHIARCRNKKKA